MSIKNNYDLVIFDCDGVLVDSEEIVNNFFYSKAVKLGLKMPRQEFISACIGGTLERSLEFLRSQIQKDIPVNFVEEYEQERDLILKNEVKLIPGVIEILEKIKIKKCVASNGNMKKMEIMFKATGIDRYFTNCIFSFSMVKHPKPWPDLFLFAAKSMGVSPEKCLVVEDSFSGIEAGISAGMTVIHYRAHEAKKYTACKVQEIYHMSELSKFLF